MATALRVSFCFFFDAHLWCQVSRTLLQYFQRYRLFSIFHFFVANNMTSSHHFIGTLTKRTSCSNRVQFSPIYTNRLLGKGPITKNYVYDPGNGLYKIIIFKQYTI